MRPIRISLNTISRLGIGLLLIISTSITLLAFGDKYAGEFLKIGVGVREMSLGGAAVAAPQAVAAAYWNPAQLASNSVFSGQFMHTEEFAGVLNLDYLAVALPMRSPFAYGLGYFRLGVDGISDTRSALIDDNGNGQLDAGERLDPSKFSSFGASESALLFALARSLKPNLNCGGTLKILNKSLGTTHAWGVGFDLGALYELLPGLMVGGVLRDVTTTFLYYPDGSNEFILPSIQLGSSFTWAPKIVPLVIRPSLGWDLTFEGETNQADFNLGFISSGFRAGLELQFKRAILLRAGRDNLGNLHVGLGLETAVGSLDYALAMDGSYAELGQSQRVGLTLHFRELGKAVKKYL
jgi:hypothetical protein